MTGPPSSTDADRDDVRVRQRAVGDPLHDGRLDADRVVAAVGLDRPARAGPGVPRHDDDHVQVDRRRTSRATSRRARGASRSGRRSDSAAARHHREPPASPLARVGPRRRERARDRRRRGRPCVRRDRRAEARGRRPRSECRRPRGRRGAGTATRARSRRWSGTQTTRGRRSRRSPPGAGGRAASCSRTATGSCTRSAARTRRAADVTLATLMDYLPADNDPGCTAGFAHGLVTGVAPDIDPSAAARGGGGVRARRETRYQRYSCIHGFGHAFMRIYGDRLDAGARPLPRARAAGGARLRAGRLPRLLVRGRRRRRRDAVGGRRDRPAPALRAQPRDVRAAVLVPRLRRQPARGLRRSTRRATSIALCAGLAGLQRAGVHHGGLGDRPARPGAAARLCAGLADAADAASCVRGTKVQNLLGYPTGAFVDLIGRCERFGGAARAGVLPLARQDARGAHRRRVRARRVPAARVAGAHGSARPGAAHRRGARHVQLRAGQVGRPLAPPLEHASLDGLSPRPLSKRAHRSYASPAHKGVESCDSGDQEGGPFA